MLLLFKPVRFRNAMIRSQDSYLGLSSILCKELIERSRNPNQQRQEQLDEEDEYELNAPSHIMGTGNKDPMVGDSSNNGGAPVRTDSPGKPFSIEYHSRLKTISYNSCKL